jgi:hypothetical protein
MSSLWTPSGEHPVDRPGRGAPAGSSPGPSAPPGAGPGVDLDDAEAIDLDSLPPDQRAAAEEYARQIEEARSQLLETPAGLVIGQQALQFYDLAALHLSQPEPRLADARLAIDALAAVVERLGPGLGEAETPLRQALNQIQLAYVQVAGAAGAGPAAESGPPEQ